MPESLYLLNHRYKNGTHHRQFGLNTSLIKHLTGANFNHEERHTSTQTTTPPPLAPLICSRPLAWDQPYPRPSNATDQSIPSSTDNTLISNHFPYQWQIKNHNFFHLFTQLCIYSSHLNTTCCLNLNPCLFFLLQPYACYSTNYNNILYYSRNIYLYMIKRDPFHSFCT